MRSNFARATVAGTTVALALLLLGNGNVLAAADTLVVCPDTFRPALQPWLDYRQTQGHSIRVITSRNSIAKLRTTIREEAESGELKSILLIGDVTLAGDFAVPTHYAKAEVNIHFGGEKTIATDNWYADLDDDQLPDLAIGRLTADTPQELTTMIDKIIQYEKSKDFTPWRRRVNFVAGVGGFGYVLDSIIENTTKMLLTSALPPSYRMSMTYGNWRSPYCPDPRMFRDVTIGRLNEGCLFWVYVGHGLPRQVDYVHMPDRLYPIFSNHDVPHVASKQGAPVAVFLSCYAGAFDAQGDCLGEALLRKKDGPVAVLASTRKALPYGLGVLGKEMLDECFVNRRETLGEIMLEAKRRSVPPREKDPFRQTLDTLAKSLSPVKDKLQGERKEHVLLVNLLGDPLMRIKQPKPIEVSAPDRARGGEEIDVAFTSPVEGKATIEVTVRRDRLTFRPPARKKYEPTDAKLSQFNKVYVQANDPTLVRQQIVIDGKRQSIKLKLPLEAQGPCHVQVYVEGQQEHALGSVDITLRRSLEKPDKPTLSRSNSGSPRL